MHALKKAFAAFAFSALSAFALLAALPAAPVAAQPYPPNQCNLALSVSAAIPGETIIAGSANCSPGFSAGATVEITLESDPVHLATVTADADGQFSTPVTIPGDATPGSHSVVATGQGPSGSTPTIRAGLMIMSGTAGAGAGGTARSGALAFTGSDSLPLVWIALALLTVGTALVLAVRRRAQTRRSLSS